MNDEAPTFPAELGDMGSVQARIGETNTQGCDEVVPPPWRCGRTPVSARVVTTAGQLRESTIDALGGLIEFYANPG